MTGTLEPNDRVGPKPSRGVGFLVAGAILIVVGAVLAIALGATAPAARSDTGAVTQATWQGTAWIGGAALLALGILLFMLGLVRRIRWRAQQRRD